jgi:hypothetical protein
MEKKKKNEVVISQGRVLQNRAEEAAATAEL